MNENERELLEQMHRKVIEQSGAQPLRTYEQPTVYYTDLPAGSADSQIANEWNTYRREVGQLLAEGHENRWVLIKGDQIIGIWDTCEEAKAIALRKYLMQPCLIQQVRRYEPIVRMSSRFWACQR
jgi:hypothetical protein